MPGSYTTYLESYEMPYIYISPEGTLADLLTAAHEYGHFVDGYVNCNQTFSIDCSEVFSQALEYLTLGSTSLGFARAAELRQYKLYDSLETFLTQACYYAFECKAYALPDSELTVGKLNELFAECCVDFGLFDEASGGAGRAQLDRRAALFLRAVLCHQLLRLERRCPSNLPAGAGNARRRAGRLQRPAVCRAGVDVPRHAARTGT